MPFNPIITLGGLAAAALFTLGATGTVDWLSAPDQESLAHSELVTLSPGSFAHPLPGEFLRQNHPVSAPVVRATLQAPFEIMKYQVSASEYRRCVVAGACKPADGRASGNVPVTGVSHIDAESYADWLSAESGFAWRLPTDIEWAYAAGERFRGDIEGGDTDPNNPARRWLVQYRTEASLGREPDPQPRIRGGFGPNSKGVADIAGNVWEWTSTCYVHATEAADGTSIASSIDNCGVHAVEGFHRTYMSNFIRDGKSGGCAVGTPPAASGDFSNLTEQDKWLLKYSQSAEVKVIGVWDTVGSVGLAAGNIPGFSRSTFNYLQTGLRIHILNGYHALAIDEHRNDFAPTLWDVRHPKDQNAVIAQARSLSAVEQRWFVGAHGNVGGGYQTDLLAQAPLRWMMKRAESQGLSFRSEVDLDGDALTAPIADAYKSFGSGLYAMVSPPLYRTIGREPDVREDGSHINVNETIDASVFERWRADPTYRPANLVEWAQRKKVDPAQLRASVRADDPRVDVPDQ